LSNRQYHPHLEEARSPRGLVICPSWAKFTQNLKDTAAHSTSPSITLKVGFPSQQLPHHLGGC
jgi:hypothetical protein